MKFKSAALVMLLLSSATAGFLYLGMPSEQVQPNLAMAATITESVIVPISAPVSAVIVPAVVAPEATSSVDNTPSVHTVVIDAGHQTHPNNTLEPIGPGSKTKKPSVSSGASGRVTHKHEYDINLKVALLLRDKLVARGVKVIMIRTTNHVNIPNSKRAKVANDAKADLFIRIHCDGNGNRAVHGFSTLYPGSNRWTKPITAASKTAAKFVQAAALKSSRATDRHTVARTDLAGFNWCRVPVVLVEMGFMSNSAEDRKLATVAYQDKLATGISNGAMSYLNSISR